MLRGLGRVRTANRPVHHSFGKDLMNSPTRLMVAFSCFHDRLQPLLCGCRHLPVIPGQRCIFTRFEILS